MATKLPMRTCSYCNGSGVELDPVQIGVEMRAKRIAKKKSLREVAGFMGFSPPYISDLERGNRSFNDELIKLFLRAL